MKVAVKDGIITIDTNTVSEEERNSILVAKINLETLETSLGLEGKEEYNAEEIKMAFANIVCGLLINPIDFTKDVDIISDALERLIGR
ncbi:hypothetical protein ACPA0F_08965 [Solibacillus silvestris]